MATVNLGRIKFVNRGTYNNSTAYTADDVVIFTDTVGGLQNTSAYIATASTTGNAPASGGTVHGSWQVLAQGAPDRLPSQSGQSGKFLKTDGSSLSFATAGGLVQAKQFIKNSTINNGNTNDVVLGAPFDGTANITPAAAGNMIKVTYYTTGDHGTTWRAGYHRVQYSTDGGSSYKGVAGGSMNVFNNSESVGNMISFSRMHIPNTNNNVKFRVISHAHVQGNCSSWGQYNNEAYDNTNATPPTDGGVVACGHGLLLEEFESSICTLSTTS